MDRVAPSLSAHDRRRMQMCRAGAYSHLTAAYGNQGQTELVAPWYLKALRIHRQLGNRDNEATSLNNRVV